MKNTISIISSILVIINLALTLPGLLINKGYMAYKENIVSIPSLIPYHNILSWACSFVALAIIGLAAYGAHSHLKGIQDKWNLLHIIAPTFTVLCWLAVLKTLSGQSRPVDFVLGLTAFAVSAIWLTRFCFGLLRAE